MIRCRACGATHDLQLTQGKLYCLACLPLEGLPDAQRYEVVRRRNQAVREAVLRRQEARSRRCSS